MINLEVQEGARSSVLDDINRAYYEAVYGVTKAILSPVVDSITDTLTVAVTKAVKQGVEDAVPQLNLWEVLLGKKTMTKGRNG